MKAPCPEPGKASILTEGSKFMLAEVQGPPELDRTLLVALLSSVRLRGQRLEGSMMKAGLEQEVCPKCEKPVYDAEGFPAGGRRYHKRCFKCFSCSKKLEPTTVLCHKVRLTQLPDIIRFYHFLRRVYTAGLVISRWSPRRVPRYSPTRA